MVIKIMDILEVEKNLCIGCGACIAIDEEHFNWDDEGLSEVISNDNLNSLELTNAIESCPTGAIRIAKSNDGYESTTNEEKQIDFNASATVMASNSN